MSDEALRLYYEKAGETLLPINEWRLALLRDDKDGAWVIKRRLFKTLREAWHHELTAMRDYWSNATEWRVNHGVWKHGGKHGEEPPRPEWPECIPSYMEAMSIVRHLWRLEITGSVDVGDSQGEAHEVFCELESMVIEIDRLKRLIDTPREDETDGFIDRNKLAALLGVRPKTLTNRADELPKPIARDARKVPIYQYSEVRSRLVKMYPGQSFMLPPDFRQLRQEP